MTLPRLLTIMGSGETAPTMMRTHRDLIARLGGDARAVVLDTPYGFQENAAELASRAVEYFRTSVGHPIEVAGLTRVRDADPVAVEQAMSRLRRATYVFAGPGSPTYALHQWVGSAVPDVVRGKMRVGGAVTFASAAALTLGRFTVPVYEVYKVGLEPYWMDGLDVLGEAGLNVAVIPHYDNAEGGHHDTRFCYLGERRLRLLEAMLPEDAHVLGVDEHTGVVLDLDSDSATIVGNGTVTVRVRGESTVYRSGDVVPIDALRHPARATSLSRSPHAGPAPAISEPDAVTQRTSLGSRASMLEADFDAAIAVGDADGAVRCVLELESEISAWSADTLQSDEMDRARAALRSMIARLGEAAVGGLADPRAVVGPYMDAIIDVRRVVRADKRYDLSDIIRDRLADIGVEVRDTPDGVEWHLG